MKVLPVLKFEGVSIEEQFDKVLEELIEVIEAYSNQEGTPRIMEEAADLLTASLTLSYMLGTEAEIDMGIAINFMKHKQRGNQIIGLWEVTKV